jgi:uncharacterized caspase-like protein
VFSENETTLHALVVGIDHYADPSIGDLAFAKRDAVALTDLLRSSNHHRSTQVHALLDEQATREAIIGLLGTKLPMTVSEDDVVLFFFAGHGMPELTSGVDELSRYLVCHDTQRSALLATSIDIGADFPRLMRRLRAKVVIFVIDACFSGYSGGRGIVGPRFAEYRQANRPAVHLADLPLGEGMVTIAAANDDEVAWETAELGHGVFSYFFLRELARREAGTVGVATLYDSVYRHVREFSKGRQNPVLRGRVAGAAFPLLGVNLSTE